VRPGELRSATWEEINLETAEWLIPAHKMKMKIEHIVPLASQAVSILRDLHRLTGHAKYVFPSIRTFDKCMSENTLNAALRGMEYSKEVMTAHGFRATARTIMDEVLGERVDLIEHQLAHAVKDSNGRAYNHTAHLPDFKCIRKDGTASNLSDTQFLDLTVQPERECRNFLEIPQLGRSLFWTQYISVSMLTFIRPFRSQGFSYRS